MQGFRFLADASLPLRRCLCLIPNWSREGRGGLLVDCEPEHDVDKSNNSFLVYFDVSLFCNWPGQQGGVQQLG